VLVCLTAVDQRDGAELRLEARYVDLGSPVPQVLEQCVVARHIADIA
jgi:hypothetical protein